MLLDGFEPSFPPYQRGVLPLHTMGALVLPRGIEPRSSVLQTGAMTTSAKAACFGVTDESRTHTVRNHNPGHYHYATVTIDWHRVMESNHRLQFRRLAYSPLYERGNKYSHGLT